MAKSISRTLQPPPMEKVIFWSVALLLLGQMTWWITFQVKESRRLLQAQIDVMRAGRARALQEDTARSLGGTGRGSTYETPGTVSEIVGTLVKLDDKERIARIEADYPFVAVLSAPLEADDPQLMMDTTLYLTLRRDVLQRLESKRRMGLWRVGIQATVMVGVVLLGMAYIYRRLNMEMELMLRQRNFIAAVTHELKTPIASLRVWIETLFTHNLPDARKERIQRLMDGDLVRLTELVSNLLEVARADAGRMDVMPEEVEVAPWLRNVCEAVDHRLGVGLLGLRMTLQNGLWASLDPRLFATVIENLLSNAFKYAGEPRETHVMLESDGEFVVIAVADRGHGFSPKESTRVFQRFYRVGDEMTRQVAGTGLGLFLAREIVLRHHGTIHASSLGPGLGATFTVRIPQLPR